MKIGLYFGSFNPIHIGHMALANYMAEFTDLQQVWFVVSPQNPLKPKSSLLNDYQRYEMVYRAIDDYPKFRVSTIEFSMPKPSYTVDTLAYLYDKYPQHQFVLIMGADSMQSFPKWKNYETILKLYSLYIVEREGCDIDQWRNHPQIKVVNVPLLHISATFIRQSIKEGKNMQFFIPHGAFQYLDEMNFYKK